MKITHAIATQLREAYFGKNWTAVSLKDKLDGISMDQANESVGRFHSIARLVYHINYYIRTAILVMKGTPIHGDDLASFECDPLQSEKEWHQLRQDTWNDLEELAKLIEQFPDERLMENFVDDSTGSYFRCLHGRIEHAYYHMGQISILRTLMQSRESLKEQNSVE